MFQGSMDAYNVSGAYRLSIKDVLISMTEVELMTLQTNQLFKLTFVGIPIYFFLKKPTNPSNLAFTCPISYIVV